MAWPKHILSDEGILTSFSIAKKIDSKQVKKIKDKAKKDGSSDAEIKKKINDVIMFQTKKAVEQNEIPGLVWSVDDSKPEKVENTSEDKRMIELTYLASLLSKKIVEKNLNKYDSCYLINAMINLLGLSEEDFEVFYEKFSGSQEQSSDESDFQDDWNDEENDDLDDGEEGYGRE